MRAARVAHVGPAGRTRVTRVARAAKSAEPIRCLSSTRPMRVGHIAGGVIVPLRPQTAVAVPLGHYGRGAGMDRYYSHSETAVRQ
jgi:hypothetical protein